MHYSTDPGMTFTWVWKRMKERRVQAATHRVVCCSPDNKDGTQAPTQATHTKHILVWMKTSIQLRIAIFFLDNILSTFDSKYQFVMFLVLLLLVALDSSSRLYLCQNAAILHPTEGSVNGTVHHWGKADCHPGPLHQAVSEEGRWVAGYSPTRGLVCESLLMRPVLMFYSLLQEVSH